MLSELHAPRGVTYYQPPSTSAPFANLDLDDVSSFGPETVRILQMNSGTSRYSVHDYSNKGSNPSTALGASGAKVQVYTATGVQTFYVPASAGTLWTVFEAGDAWLIARAAALHPKARP